MGKTAVYRQPGHNISYTNSGAEAINVGDVVVLGKRIVIALANIAVGATGDVTVTGVFQLPAVNNAEFNVGDAIYWDAQNQVATKVASDNPLAGWATAKKETTATVAYVRIDDGHDATILEAVETLSTAIGDPGDLTTTEKASLVGAINELVSSKAAATSVGDLTDLTTDEQGSVVGAINELDAALDDKADADDIGDLATLTTEEKTSVVGAINEVDAAVSDVADDVGDLTTLMTDEKTSLVAAINELVSRVAALEEV